MYIKEGFDFKIIYDEETCIMREQFPNFTMPSFEHYSLALKNSRTLAFLNHDQCIGGMMIHDHHVHLLVFRAYHGKWASLWPAAFRWALNISDPLYALMPVENKKIIRFISAIGGQFEKEELAYGGFICHRYRLETHHMRYPNAASDRRLVRG